MYNYNIVNTYNVVKFDYNSIFGIINDNINDTVNRKKNN